jgi:A/G-specific adenine glycosylase
MTFKDTCQVTLDPTVTGSIIKTNPPTIREFQKIVLDHYQKQGRDLIWRKTQNPYYIMVSEIMLQQTQVERVETKFSEFIDNFPDFSSLAYAPLADILRVWQGMGYNRRAIALQKCAQRVIAEFDGMLPADVDTLATFPGIGHATASSICAFAFNMPVVFIETNIRRVFIHFFFGDQEAVTDAEIQPLVEQALYCKDPCIWYNALMDLGTELKKTVPNPNRRSRHYTKQSAFEGSDRKIRGDILKLLLEEKRMTLKKIYSSFTEDQERIYRILTTLENEGFVTRSGSLFTITSG